MRGEMSVKKNTLQLALGLCVLAWMPCAQAQISPVKLKVSMHSKSNTKETFRTTDGMYRSADKSKTVYYSIDLTNISSGPAKDFVVKWAVLVRSDRDYWMNGQRMNESRVVQGEKSFSLEFAKSSSLDTDVIELSGYEWVGEGSHRSEYGAKIVGYAVEVFCNDQKVATDIKPPDVKTKIDQFNGNGEQKKHSF
jgi:hypothetical protein